MNCQSSRLLCDTCPCFKSKQFFKFPETGNQRDEIKHGLFRVEDFPCVLGCIDTTHVKIKAPSQNNPNYVNWEGYHSLNVLAICYHEGK